ncbi:MAG: hypothetical protein NT175_12380 [Bacteroidetes bacterium]|nr:hypothetical protein [Bacteroidota bacterium]
MGKLKFKAGYLGPKNKINVVLALITFKENDICFVYSPTLDITGYGNTDQEARDSFNIALKEFLRYTTNKKTLNDELKRLGWTIVKHQPNPIYNQPFLDQLLRDKSYLKDIIREKEFSRINERVALPVM